MSAAEIAAALGGAQRSGAWWRCRCPVHGSHGASLALRDGDRAPIVVKCWAGCNRRDVLAALRQLGLLNGDAGADFVPRDPEAVTHWRDAEAQSRQRRIALARDMIAASLPSEGTPVARYLAERIPGMKAIPAALRYLPSGDAYARHRTGGRRPVLVAAVEHVAHGVVGAHRTWLAPDGSGKASLDPVRISTGPVGGGSVRLAPVADGLLVGEGIETVLAAMIATGRPGWAALSTSGLIALLLPPVVRTVVILADHDFNGTGERAARTAAERWLAEGRRVRIAVPPKAGADWADVLTGRDREAGDACTSA